MNIFNDIYKIFKLYVNFPLQDIFLEISNIKMYFRYFFATLKNHQIDIREKMAPIISFPGYLFDFVRQNCFIQFIYRQIHR